MLKTFITSLLRGFILFFITTLSLPLSAQDNLIIVGQAIDLSGPNAAVGRDYVAGITTFFDSINSHGGIHGKRVRYLVRDDQGNPANSAKLAAELIERDKADFLIGGIGASTVDAVVATPAFQQSKISLFAPLSGVQKQYGGRVVYWRPSAEQEMQYIFSYFDKLGIRQVGIALQENSVNHDMYQYVVNEIQRRKMTLSGVVKITGNPAELSRESAKLAAGNPNIVITVADTVATGLFLKSFRRSAPKVFVAGLSLTNLDTVAELAGRSALEWTVFSQVVPNPLGKKSVVQIDHSNMMKKFRDEELSSLTFEGFLVAKTLSRAMQNGRGGRDAFAGMTGQKNQIDLGGFLMTPDEQQNRISGFVDIALFRKGGGLLF